MLQIVGYIIHDMCTFYMSEHHTRSNTYLKHINKFIHIFLINIKSIISEKYLEKKYIDVFFNENRTVFVYFARKAQIKHQIESYNFFLVCHFYINMTWARSPINKYKDLFLFFFFSWNIYNLHTLKTADI